MSKKTKAKKRVRKAPKPKAVKKVVAQPVEPTALEIHQQHIANVKKIARDKKTVGAKCVLGIVKEEKIRAKDDRTAKVKRDASRDHTV